QGGAERGLVDYLATGRVHQRAVRPQKVELPATDEMARLGVQRDIERGERRPLEQRIEVVGEANPAVGMVLAYPHIRIVRPAAAVDDERAAEAEEQPCGLARDAAEADDADDLGADLADA